MFLCVAFVVPCCLRFTASLQRARSFIKNVILHRQMVATPLPQSSAQEIQMAKVRLLLGDAVTDVEVLSKVAFALLVAEIETEKKMAAAQIALKDTEILLKDEEILLMNKEILLMKEAAAQLALKDEEIAAKQLTIKNTENLTKERVAQFELMTKEAEVAKYRMWLASVMQRYAFRSLATSSLVFFSPLLKTLYCLST